MDPGEVLAISAKLGLGVRDLLDTVVQRVPPPVSAGRESNLRLFLFDSWWDRYHGSINLVQARHNQTLSTYGKVRFKFGVVGGVKSTTRTSPKLKFELGMRTRL